MQDTDAAARPRRVLMIAPTSFFADYGCHVRIYEQARGLTARGHKVLLCTYHSGRDVPGLSIVRTPALPWRRRIEIGASWHRLLLDFLLLCTAWRAARRHRPDVIHAFLHEGALIGTLIARLAGVPLLADLQGSLSSEVVEHGTFPPGHRVLGLLRRLESWVDRQPARLLANTHHTARWLMEDFGIAPAKVRVVPDVVDTERFAPERLSAEERQGRRQALGIPPDGFLLVYVGLLAPYQGIDLLLHSFAQVAQQIDAYLLVMGFPHMQRYQRQAEALGIGRRVTFTGPVSYFELPAWLALGDAAVSLKLSQTEGNVKLLNYMAMGLPVVALDTPVGREYLGEAGVFIPQGDSQALAEVVCRLAREPAERWALGRRLRERAVVEFPLSRAIDAMEAAYGEVCPAPAPML